MDIDQKISLAQKKLLKSDYGPISFGLVTSASLVSWSGKDSIDLILYQLGRGLYLYPTKNLTDDELNNEPIKIYSRTDDYLPYEEVAVPADWNKDGNDDFIVAGMTGYLYYLERKGNFPDLTFEHIGPLKDEEKNLIFNIPYDNLEHPAMNNLNGYFDTAFFNYPSPTVYPTDESGRINLIIGDWAGNLWWLHDLSDGSGKPVYRGERYVKPKKEIVSKKGKALAERFGYEYVKPMEKICDESGKPFILGEGFDTGFKYRGGVTRPILYYNRLTDSCDLIVLAGTTQPVAYYLQKVCLNEKGKPVFKNLGEISFSGLPDLNNDLNKLFGCHSKIAVYEYDGWINIILSANNNVAVFRNKRVHNQKPEFEFDRWISGENVATSGSTFSEILSDIKGRRYLLDIPSEFKLREIKVDNGEVKLSSEEIIIRDQQGVFKPEGETDPQGGKDWGFHRASVWDFDGSGKQHLIVGTDKGLFYLLIEEEKLGTKGEFKYKSVGPLKDEDGNIIKVHNRACACAIDLDGDGAEDLVLGGASYQLGIKTDPTPGGGFYYMINKGVDEQGKPVLEGKKPLIIEGHDFNFHINTHVHLQAVDLDKDGEKEVILANQGDGFKGWIFKPAKKFIGVEYTGKYIECVWWEKLLDIDNDGELELVWAGSEEGIGYYFKLSFL